MYKKIIRIRTNDAMNLQLGKLINIMTTELNLFERNTITIFQFYLTPISLFFSMLILYYVVGLAFLFGVTYCCVLIIIFKKIALYSI